MPILPRQGSETESREAAGNVELEREGCHSRTRKTGTKREEWGQGGDREDLSHLHMAWAAPGLSSVLQELKQRVGGRGTHVLINMRLKR